MNTAYNKNYVDERSLCLLMSLKGRIRRRTYWWTHVLIFLVYLIIVSIPIENEVTAILLLAFLIYFSLLSISLTVRRLQDIGKTGWLVLLLFVPIVNFVASLIFFVLCCRDSEYGENAWGPNPKGIGMKTKEKIHSATKVYNPDDCINDTVIVCTTCGGSGKNAAGHLCPTCNGAGALDIACPVCKGFGYFSDNSTCTQCNGTGRIM